MGTQLRYLFRYDRMNKIQLYNIRRRAREMESGKETKQNKNEQKF